MGERWWGRAESLIHGQLKSHPFPDEILAEAISMTHSGMLYRLVISTFYLYDPLLFQIFFPWKFIKSMKCLLSLLQSAATQITISINNLFVSHIIQYKISFFIKIYVKVLYIQIWFKREAPAALIFSNKNHGLKKKTRHRKEYEKIIELHVVHTWYHMQSE